MIQRLLYDALQRGLKAIKDDPGILTDLFQDWQLEDTEVAAIKTLFARKPPTVVQGYARSDTTFPCYAITLDSETEVEKYLGDDEGMISDPDDEDFGADVYGAHWEHAYTIMCYAEHPDACTYYYEVAKTILLLAGPWFTTNRLYGRTLSGADLAPDPRYLPEHLFCRTLSFRCRREFELTDTASKAGRAWKLAGLFVDRSGSPSDPGAVATRITPVVSD